MHLILQFNKSKKLPIFYIINLLCNFYYHFLFLIFFSHIDNISVIAIDEAVLAYQPSSQVKEKAKMNGEPIPVVFIPRKPHPNGLEIFLSVTYIDNPIDNKKV